MRSLEDARRRGRECRAAVDQRPEPTLIERLLGFIQENHKFYPEVVHPDELDGCHARLEQPYLYYDERLELTPDDLLLQLSHELGHLEQHSRVKAEPHRSYAVNPLASAPYVEHHDVVAVARYSQRSLEEAEATAFAVEFLCPSEDIFAAWQVEPEVDLSELAARFHVSVDLARVQLASAIFAAAAVVSDEVPSNLVERRKNPAQDRAVVWPEREDSKERRPLLVDAGPGTGKTETLVRRAVHLIKNGHAEPEQVLVLTFSNEAAFELKERLRHRLGSEVAQRMMVATFHGFGRHLLHYLGGRFETDVPGKVPVLDEAGQEQIILDVLGRADAADRFGPLLKLYDLGTTAADAVRHLNHLKQRLWDPPRLREATQVATFEGTDDPAFVALVELFEAYEAEKATRGYVDFADLIALPLKLLTEEEYEDSAAVVRAQYPHVLVDEFQDVSEAVGLFLKALCKDQNPPWVVGDARQSIFRFLGAHPDNVSRFLEMYDRAERIELDQNYRSCDEVVSVNNELAALIEDPTSSPSDVRKRWHAASDHKPLGEPPVTVAIANADPAEREGIAAHVAQWRAAGVPAEDIAVLARRNVDVREIALAIGEFGIKVATSGLVTAEGPAGDLAAVAAVLDEPATALTRVAATLGRDRYEKASTNAAIRLLRTEVAAREESDEATQEVATRTAPESIDDGAVEDHGLAGEVLAAAERIRAAKGIPDAFGLMTAFLFEASAYLRRILDEPIGAARTMKLAEIATALSQAALYRFTHGHLAAPDARRSFVAYFQRKLADAAPSRIAPRRVAGAVQVMTCHAAKGLQFPCVIVAGQTLPPPHFRSHRRYPRLPKALRPTEAEDLEQANALLFVGASRAQRALVISFAETAGGSEKAKQRDRPPLLDTWLERFSPSSWRWPDRGAEREVASTRRVWGGASLPRMGARAFDKGSCPIKPYLDEELGMRLPETDPPLYPFFFGRVRTVLGSLIERAHDGGRMLTPDNVEAVLDQHWPPKTLGDHRHLPLFSRLITDAALGFASNYIPLASEHRPLDLERVEASLADPAPKLRVTSAFWDDTERLVVVLFRPESLVHGISKRKGGLNWSVKGLDDERLRIVILRQAYPEATAYVYSAADAELYEWNPPGKPRKGSLPAQERLVLEAQERQEMFARGPFEHEVSFFECGRCRRRLYCPYWNGLTEP